MKLEIIETDRLILRRLTDEDYGEIFGKLSDAEIMNMLYIRSLTELELERKKQQKGYSTFNKRMLTFQILNKHSLINIGWCGYHTWYIEHNRAEIGYGLIETERDKGYMSEALKVILNYGFEKMKLNRIEAFVGPDNISSNRLVEKFNFQKEGILREHYYNNGKLEDSIVYGLLKSDTNFDHQNTSKNENKQ